MFYMIFTAEDVEIDDAESVCLCVCLFLEEPN